jgi:hypothetical protein
MPAISIVQFALVALAVLAVWGGLRSDTPALIHAGILLVGASLAATGLYSAFTGRAHDYRRGYGWEMRHGLGARLEGLALAVAGGALGLVAVLLLLGLGEAVRDLGLRRPSFVAIPVSLALMLYGAGMVVGPNEWRLLAGWEQALTLPARLAGAALAGLGIAALGLGLFEFASPASFDAWLSSLIGPLLQELQALPG